MKPQCQISIIAAFLVFSACADPHWPEEDQSELVSLDASEDTYDEDCIRHWYFYCPPLDAVWRKECVVDICDSDRIVECGECIELFECDPTGPTYHGLESCTTDNGLDGKRKKWCDKGFWSYGECSGCTEEICDGLDNDCDGLVDEGTFPCSTECGDGLSVCIGGEVALCDAKQPSEEICDGLDNDCDGLVDEGQLNACGACGSVDSEVCDGVDNDCDGFVDEDLFKDCSTDCGSGFRVCFAGQWGECNAQQPYDEVCDGIDNDCDGLVDEDIYCGCTADQIGALFPCLEPPVVCGQGWKTCECVDPECSQIALTQCAPLCVYVANDENCDPNFGAAVPEICNNHDDNCNQLVDEDLYAGCYTGPIGTEGVGLCQGGQAMCQSGKWGAFDALGLFAPGLCDGEVLPLPEDLCDGADGNCDGVVSKEVVETDILFIIDGSGSMTDEIDAVAEALKMFSSHYQDEDLIRWGLILGPTKVGFNSELLVMKTPLTKFQNFMSILMGSDQWELHGGWEMLYDALYLSVLDLVDPSNHPVPSKDLSWGWQVGGSIPAIDKFSPGWREDVKRVVVVFSDEEGQSFLDSPDGKSAISQNDVISVLKQVEDLSVYTFSDFMSKNGAYDGWEPVSVGGKWFELTSNSLDMYSSLLEILDEAVCEGGKP